MMRVRIPPKAIFNLRGIEMMGAICGDIIGSVYEGNPVKTKDFPLITSASSYTDDTVLTVAIADAILNGRPYAASLRMWYQQYPNIGYGPTFRAWGKSGGGYSPGSAGNGSAMRVSPVAYAGKTLEDVLDQAKMSAEPTHSHPEGIRGAEAVAAAVFLARGGSKAIIKSYVEQAWGYDLSMKLDDIRDDYQFNATCQGSVPQSIIAFLESTDYEDAIRNAVSLGGDADTMACIAGAIAAPFYGGVPEKIYNECIKRLDDQLRTVAIMFEDRFKSK